MGCGMPVIKPTIGEGIGTVAFADRSVFPASAASRPA
jgi:hypothetical protein